MRTYNMRAGISKIQTKTTIALTAASLILGGVGFSLTMYATVQAVPNTVCNVPTTYATIQAAVNAPGCSTIKVAAGTYAESVTISRPLTLEGAKSGHDARSRSGAESVISKIDDNTPNITINASNVTIDGFTLDGPASGGTASLVMQNGVSTGETIENNIINNPGRAASITTSDSTFTQNLVNNSASTISGFQGNSTPVVNNVVNDNAFTGSAPHIDADINFIEGASNETINNNDSTDGGTLIALFKTNGATVKNNTDKGNFSSSAIYIGGADSNIVASDNTVTKAGTGVNVANDFGDGANSAIKITDNLFHDNTNGIKVGTSGVALDNTVVAHGNVLTGNTTDGFQNNSTFNVNATCNWWGSASGPSSVGVGTGDNVTSYVAFSSWQDSSNGGCSNTASGDLRMANPSQQIKFNVTTKKDITNTQGNVEYWNYAYPSGLHYSATVTCSYVDPQTSEARFMFQIPSGYPGLSGLYVVAYVKDVKHSNDLYGHAATSSQTTATQWCENGVGYSPTMYTVTSGSVGIDD